MKKFEKYGAGPEWLKRTYLNKNYNLKTFKILDKLKIMRLSFTGRPTKHESSKVYLKVVFHL